MVHELLPHGMWDLWLVPCPGIEPTVLEGRFLTTGPPGKQSLPCLSFMWLYTLLPFSSFFKNKYCFSCFLVVLSLHCGDEFSCPVACGI